MAKTTRVSITEAKQHLGELVKRAAYGGETIVLEFRGKPQAAIVGYEEAESVGKNTADWKRWLAEADVLRERIAQRTGIQESSAELLEKLRLERDEEIQGLR